MEQKCMQPCDCLASPLCWLMTVATVVVWPCQGAVSGLASLFIPTTSELNQPHILLLRRLLLGPVYLILTVILLPLAACSLPLRCLLCLVRHPFQYSVVKNVFTSEVENHLSSMTDSLYRNFEFSVATANICLLPEFLARINNISHGYTRAKATGERIVVDQFFYTGNQNIVLGLSGFNSIDPAKYRDQRTLVAGLDTHFPCLDFLCLQEVFDWTYNKVLRKELHKVFPYIIHDVGVTSLKTNCFLLNSGLMFASRHPVLKADFKCFSSSAAQCRFTSKGLLMVKVLIGKELRPKQKVGYIFTTHLQAYQGPYPIIHQQLNEILKWIEDFRKETKDDNDQVLFDILCGDFNFDNISPGDKENREHSVFDIYADPCRVIPGKDHDWTVGTEFKQIFMHDTSAGSPESLKSSLSDPVLRHRYLLDADVYEQSMDTLVRVRLRTDAMGNLLSFPAAGKRRIDYVLYKKDVPVDVSAMKFITRLASLTDHIPVSMSFRVKS